MKVLRGRLESGPQITVNYLLYMSSDADEPWKDTHRLLHPTLVHPEELKQACVCFCECRPNLETWNCISEPCEPQFSYSHLLYTSLSLLVFSCTLHYSSSRR